MKFIEARKFLGQSMSDALQYLRTDLSKALHDLFAGLANLTISENFAHFYVTVSIASGATETIPNRLKREDFIWWPTRITATTAGTAASLVEGAGPGGEASGRDFIYIRNNGATAVQASLLFMRK